VEVLRRGSKMGFNSLVYRSGLARQTVHNHLRHLVNQGLVLKEAVRQGRGRPTIPYFIPRQVALASKDVVVVSLTFQRLRSICRFKKGGILQTIEKTMHTRKLPKHQRKRNLIYFSLVLR